MDLQDRTTATSACHEYGRVRKIVGAMLQSFTAKLHSTARSARMCAERVKSFLVQGRTGPLASAEGLLFNAFLQQLSLTFSTSSPLPPVH